MTISTEALASQFSQPGLTFESGPGGLPRMVIDTELCRGSIFLHGAHVAAFQPQGQREVLWLSRESQYATDKPIRGGVPICFPWFANLASDPSAPTHGYARLRDWELVDTIVNSDGSLRVELATEIDQYQLRFAAEFGSLLLMTLTVELSTQAKSPATFEEALHTYLAVSDIHSVHITGLESRSYIDKLAQGQQQSASRSAIRFDGECDRVYLDTEDTCILHDPGWARTIAVKKRNSRSTIVWNPWIAKSQRMTDFGDDEWPGMVCIETANVGEHAIRIEPGQRHEMSAAISLGTQ